MLPFKHLKNTWICADNDANRTRDERERTASGEHWFGYDCAEVYELQRQTGEKSPGDMDRSIGV